MKIKTIVLGQIQTNCYLISSDKSALVIDPAFYSKSVEDFLLENDYKERLILITHAHFDHISGAEELRRKTGVKIAIGEIENQYLSDANINLSELFGERLNPFSADILLEDGQEIELGELNIKTIHTPGHTKGGVCYMINGKLFSGDTLFYESIGRTDFPTGDYKILMHSINKLFESLDGETEVFSGHGFKTTLNHERLYNPFLEESLI